MPNIKLREVSIYLLMCADDYVFFEETPEELQLLLNQLKPYANKWSLTVNVNKTKVIVF